MTALLWWAEPERLCLAMDTCSLGIDEETGDRFPGPFCSKILLWPQFRGLMCGTGNRALIYYWHSVIQQNAVAKSIIDLDDLAVEHLPELADRCSVDDELTATIYHFGFAEPDDQLVGRAFRSTNGFAKEELQYGLAMKPPDGTDFAKVADAEGNVGLPQGFVELMKQQKAYDDARPPNERLGIGGEIQYVEMTKDGFSLRTVHRFDDYGQHFERARELHPSPVY